MKRILTYIEGHKAGEPEELIFKKMGIFYYKAKDSIKSSASLFKSEHLYDFVDKIIELERILKSENHVYLFNNKKINLKGKHFLEKIIHEYCI